MPLLETADSVHVLGITESAATGGPDTSIVAALARHGGRATARSSSAVTGSVGEEILSSIAELGTDLLVMGAVSRGAIARSVIGHTAEKVIDEVECDVFIVKPRGFKSAMPKVRPRRKPVRNDIREFTLRARS